MSFAPQIRLRTLFLLFVCFSVGLASSANPLGAIEPAIGTAMVIGLAQQTRRLWHCRPPLLEKSSEIRFSRTFAIVWRSVVGIVHSGSLLWNTLLARGFASPRITDGLLTPLPLEYGLPVLCVLVVICNSLFRWRCESYVRKSPSLRAPLLWIFGSSVVLLMVLQLTMTDFFVHEAVAGIEFSEPPEFQRPGVYVKLASDGYLPLWFGGAAVACVLATGILATRIHKRSRGNTTTIMRRAIPFAMLAVPIAYCIWHYGYEFHRLSPEIAGAGLAITPIDAFGAFALATPIVIAGAYRVGWMPSLSATISTSLREDIEQRAFHESFPCLMMLTANSCYYLVTLIRGLLTYQPFIGAPSIGRIISTLSYPSTLLSIATIAAFLQFVWIRWRMRHIEIPERLFALSPYRFVEGGALLALIIVVSAPTLRAFAFTMWLGPWNLLPFFGL